MFWFNAETNKKIDILSLEIINLTLDKERLELEVQTLKEKLLKFEPPVPEFKIGDRVKGNEYCGFDRAMKGTIQYVEPNGKTIWVRRDGSSSDCFYGPKELELIK